MKTVVVISLPRSGSSLLAGILHRLGVKMGSNKGLVKGRHANKYGNYENQDFLRLNYYILIKAGSSSFSWADIPNDKEIFDSVQLFKPFIKRIIRKNESELWGWKDPSVIYTLPYFEKYLTNPYYIVLKRDIESMVKSHLKLSKVSNWFFDVRYVLRYLDLRMSVHLLWNVIKRFILKGNPFNDKKIYREVIKKGYKRINKFVKGKKYIKIDFNDLVSDTPHTINKIVEFLDISPSIKRFQNAKAFLDFDEVHFRKFNRKKNLSKKYLLTKSAKSRV